MRGMSSAMGKPISRRNSIRSLSGLLQEAQNATGGGSGSSINSQQQQLPSLAAEFTCGCAAGWTGPTCEISEF